jgi:hypothetical protein
MVREAGTKGGRIGFFKQSLFASYFWLLDYELLLGIVVKQNLPKMS